MVDFINKRLQVFVSSTFTDLISERQAAVEAILTAGHIPAGMELFTSGDESQMDVIKQWIDESDVFLLILGGRYGSVEPKTGKSYIHLEYEYALNAGKPLFTCVINESALDEKVRKHGKEVLENEDPKELKEFREFVLSKMSKFWDDPKDIKIAVSETLSQFSRREDLIGWIRGNQEANMPALASEIARLSKENANLREQLLHGGQSVLINGLTFDETKKIIVKKDLLKFLTTFRNDLATSPGGVRNNVNRDAIRELTALGLLKGSHMINNSTLTDAGRVFLNKLEAEKIKAEDSPENST